MYMDFQGGYLLQILNLSAQVLFTASGVPAASLRIKSHSVICAQPGGQRAGSVAQRCSCCRSISGVMAEKLDGNECGS